MRKNLKTAVMASALAVAMLSGSALHAHEDSPGTPRQMMPPSTMQGGAGGMMGMMGMMGQMKQMMDICDQMTQGMMQHHREKPRKPDQAPENKG